MITINIDKNSKFENIETYLVQLARAKEVGMPASLMFPKSLNYTYFGLIPSLIQFEEDILSNFADFIEFKLINEPKDNMKEWEKKLRDATE